MTRPLTRRRVGMLTAAVTTASATLALLPGAATAAPEAASAASKTLANQLVKAASGPSANRHLIALQRIADQNGGNRASGTPGYEASVDYVAKQLRQAGFKVSTPTYTYDEETVVSESLTSGSDEFLAVKMTASIDTPSGGITAPLAVVPEDATTGCEATDFAGKDYTGTVALIRRGGCSFEIKGVNAAAAGAAAAVVSNNVPGRLDGTITNTGPIPVAGISQEDGTALATRDGQTVTLALVNEVNERTSRNVIAQTRTGRTDNVVMSGAHLDSVPVGPGINDNGSGSSGQLEVALKLGGSPDVKNAVRFAWWGSEELGLVGSSRYVEGLSFQQQLDIALYLNFDMIGSPNAAYFVYDGDDSDGEGAGAGPFGSAQIEKTFTDFFANRLDVPSEGTDFSGRSDYGPFIAVGIPSGGLFTGAEGVKTPEQAAKWGGTAGVAYDPCYHAACDNLGNVDRVAFDRNIDAIAFAVGSYATSTKDVNGATRATAAQRAGAAKSTVTMEAHGHDAPAARS